MLELRQLHVLKAIAQEGSLAAAARALHYTQPTISHHLAVLESHFDARLVQRGPRGAALTELGAALLPHAEAVIERLRLAEREVRDLAERGAHTLHIGTFPTAGALLLPPAVKALRHAGVHISLTEGELPTLLRGLRARELHAALVFSQPGDRLDLDDDFELYPLLHDPLQLVLPEDHRCAGQAYVPLEELRDDDWIGAADPVTRATAFCPGPVPSTPSNPSTPCVRTTTRSSRDSSQRAPAWPSSRGSPSAHRARTSPYDSSRAPRWHGRSALPFSAPPPRAVFASWWRPSRNRPS